MEYIFPILQLGKQPFKKVGFDDVKKAINLSDQFLLINTLPVTEQSVLIHTTLPYEQEESRINEILKNYNTEKYIIIVYGKHAVDDSVEKKYGQLKQLGFSQVYIYSGGLFEWLLLQDIYDFSNFPTTNPPNKNLFQYRPSPILFVAPKLAIGP
jgi:hypothetical protein